MQKLRYIELQKIDIDITNKLINYANSQIDIEELLNELDYVYPYLKDDSSRFTFNIWLSIDYIDKDGKTFLEKFIEEKSSLLTAVEMKILKGKITSYVSIFQILEYKNEYIYVRDVLSNKDYKLLEPHLNDTIDEGEFLFARIGKILDDYGFIGDISYLPSSIKPLFLEELLIDFNNLRKEDPELTMKKYLKIHSLNLYKIYNESILNILEINGDIHSYLFDELEEFEGYLINKESDLKIKKHLSNLVNLFEYNLSERDLTLYNLDELDFEVFFNDAIEDNFISSQGELNSYINTLKNYLRFLSNMDSQYKDSYINILNISKNRFHYMNKLKSNDTFKIDKDFVSLISFKLNDDALNTIMDYERFIIYAGESPLDLTAKTKFIKRKNLLEINDLLESKISLKKSAPNQRDFPLIHFFYFISLKLGILKIENNNLILTEKGIIFLRLSDEEKYNLLFKYLWSKDFTKEVLDKYETDHYEKSKELFSQSISTLKANKEYKINNIFPTNPDFFYFYYKYLKYLGLIDYDLYINYSISFTSLGKKIFEYLNQRKTDFHSPVIISLDSYKSMKYWNGGIKWIDYC